MNKKARPKHGTISTYTNYLCRCVKCRAAAAAYQRDRREARAAALRAP